MKDVLKSDISGGDPKTITLETVTGTSLVAMQAAIEADGYYIFRLDRVEPEAVSVTTAITTINDFFSALGLEESWLEAFNGYSDDPVIQDEVVKGDPPIVFTPDVFENPGELVYSTAAYWTSEWRSGIKSAHPTSSSTLLNFDLPDGTELTMSVNREPCFPPTEEDRPSYAFTFEANVHRVQIPA